ncbi:MAG: dTDP-4-dehydrorhamnose reductase [Verrucomicrobia bacterium]|nr:dTDP-4-dehydrorhamnose reductase [Verrucomicrobiota bacterium]
MPEPKENKRVFIVGNRGQLGYDATQILPPEFTVHGADLPDIDITAPESVATVLGPIRPAIVWNCAAYTNVDKCESDQDAARRVNVDGPRLLAKFCEAHGALLVHVSTDYVFDGTRPVPQPYTEQDRPRPQTHYGLTKYEGELAIRAVTANHLIVRTAWLYGAHGHNFLKTMLRLALVNPEKAIRVVNDQYGCPTWSERLARQIKELIALNKTGTVHATGEGHCTWYQLASAFLRLMAVPHRIEPCTTAEYPTPAQRPANSILDNKALRDADLHVMHHWHDDLAEYVQRHRDALLVEAKAKLATK